MSTFISPRIAGFGLAVGLIVAAAGCAGPDTASYPAAIAVGAAHSVPTPQPLVTETRPAEVNYIPVGTRIQRPVRKLTPAEFEAYEAELNARKARDSAAGAAVRRMGATPPPAAPNVN